MSRKQFVFAPAALAAAVVLLLGADRSLGQKSAPDPFSEGPADGENPSAQQRIEKRAKPSGRAHPENPEKPSAQQRIEEALNEPTTLEFSDAPLSDVIEYLKTLHQIEIQIDQKALDDAGIGKDTPVTRRIKGVSLRSALNLILRDLDLTYMIVDEVLLITTPEKAEERLVTRIYDVADLVVCRDETAQRWEDYGPLLVAITATILPQSWDQAGGPASIRAGTFGSARVLIVSQTDGSHHQIADFLEEIRKVGRKAPSEEPPFRSRPHGMRMGMGGMMGPGMGAPGMMPGMGGMPGAGAKPAVKPQPKKRDP